MLQDDNYEHLKPTRARRHALFLRIVFLLITFSTFPSVSYRNVDDFIRQQSQNVNTRERLFVIHGLPPRSTVVQPITVRAPAGRTYTHTRVSARMHAHQYWCKVTRHVLTFFSQKSLIFKFIFSKYYLYVCFLLFIVFAYILGNIRK